MDCVKFMAESAPLIIGTNVFDGFIDYVKTPSSHLMRAERGTIKALESISPKNRNTLCGNLGKYITQNRLQDVKDFDVGDLCSCILYSDFGNGLSDEEFEDISGEIGALWTDYIEEL